MGVCGVVLAAGWGTRLAPFSDIRPKPSFPLGGTTLLHHALGLLRPHVDELAVNFSAFDDWFRANLPAEVEQFHEEGQPLGTAGALFNMCHWIDGRDVVVLNADSVLFGRTDSFLHALGAGTTRLLVTYDRTAPDFDGIWRFAGLSTMGAASLAHLTGQSRDLYHEVWKQQLASGDIELVPLQGMAIDCGRPADLLAANLVASGGRSVIERGAAVDGDVDSCVVLRGAKVGAGESFRHCVIGPDHVFHLDVADPGSAR